MTRFRSELPTLGFVEVPVPGRRPCGVYVLLQGNDVVWVGQTIGLEARLRLHLGQGREFDRVLWFELERSQLDRYEGALIRALLPSQTRRAPSYRGNDNDVLVAVGLPPHADEEAATREARAIFNSRDGRQRARARRLWSALAEMFARKAGV